MKASFDGIRSNIAFHFNELCCAGDDEEHRIESMLTLRGLIGGLLCMHDPDDEDDCNDLSEDIILVSPDGDKGGA